MLRCCCYCLPCYLCSSGHGLFDRLNFWVICFLVDQRIKVLLYSFEKNGLRDLKEEQKEAKKMNGRSYNAPACLSPDLYLV